MTNKIRKTITKTDIKFWILLGSIVAGMAMSWAAMSTKVSANEREIEDISFVIIKQQEECALNHEKINLNMTEIQIKLAEIQKDIVYIRGQIN